MGISTLSTQELSEHNVNGIISQLTQQFGLAFMTSVIGLPISAALRSLTIVMPLSNLSAKTQIEAQDANL